MSYWVSPVHNGNFAASFSATAHVASFGQQLQSIISRVKRSSTWVARAPADDNAIRPKHRKGVAATHHLLHVEQMMSDLSCRGRAYLSSVNCLSKETGRLAAVRFRIAPGDNISTTQERTERASSQASMRSLVEDLRY